MNNAITASELFEQQRERLELRWTAGQEGAPRRLETGDTLARRPSLAGYLNAIYPNKVQILGTEELAWLDSLDSRQRWETIQKIMHFTPLALVISKDQSCPEDLRIAAEETATPLWTSPKRGHELLNPDRIAVLGEAVDRDGVLAHAARLLAVDSVDDAAVIAECLRMRERLGSTAIGHGIAIPHGRNNA